MKWRQCQRDFKPGSRGKPFPPNSQILPALASFSNQRSNTSTSLWLFYSFLWSFILSSQVSSKTLALEKQSSPCLHPDCRTLTGKDHTNGEISATIINTCSPNSKSSSIWLGTSKFSCWTLSLSLLERNLTPDSQK